MVRTGASNCSTHAGRYRLALADFAGRITNSRSPFNYDPYVVIPKELYGKHKYFNFNAVYLGTKN
jgi:hypothetical protein